MKKKQHETISFPNAVKRKLCFQLENKREIVFDYGSGTCVNDATISIGNATIDIEL